MSRTSFLLVPLALLGVVTAAHARGNSADLEYVPVDGDLEQGGGGNQGGGDDQGGDNDAPAQVDVPSADYPTLQAGIDAVADGGTIRVATGVYHESLVVTDKAVVIEGQGARASQTRIQGSGADGAEPVFELVGAADVSLATLTVSHGGYGVRAVPAESDVALAVLRAVDVEIEVVGHGVYGTFSELEVSDSEVRNARFSGLSVEPVGRMVFTGLTVRGSEGIGLLVLNERAPSTGGVRIVGDSTFEQNWGGGLEVHGSALPVSVLNSDFDGNRVAGVTLVDADDVFLYGLDIARTASTPGAKVGWGDGVRVFGSEGVELRTSDIDSSERVGVSMYGCVGDPTEVYLAGLSIDRSAIDMEIGAPAGCTTGSAVDLSADEPSVSCDGDTCHAQPSALVPVEPPTPAL